MTQATDPTMPLRPRAPVVPPPEWSLLTSDEPSVPPRAEDLPYDDGEPMESELHAMQMDLTLDYGRWLLRGREAVVVGNMGYYFSATQAKKSDFKAPDIMFILDVPRRSRLSWVIWEEGGRHPDVIIELLSPSTRANDLGKKKDLYDQLLRIPEYFVFDPFSAELKGWAWDPQGYQPIAPDADGRLASERLGVSLGVVELDYVGVLARWLRFFKPDGTMVPTQAEAEAQRADAAAQRAEAEAQRAEAEAQRAEAEAQRAEAEAQRAEAEAQRAEAEAQRAEAEAQRADAAERALAEMRAKLAALEGR